MSHAATAQAQAPFTAPHAMPATIHQPLHMPTQAMASGHPWGSDDLQPRTLRNLLGSYPTGVAVVTTRTPDGRSVGLTINSFASLSLDPPLVLWSLVTHSPNRSVFSECAHFAINILGSGQEELALRFANPKIPHKFDGVMVQETDVGIPVLQNAVTTLLCEHDHNRQTGDHLLLIGRVVRTASRPGSPLVFHAGRFTSLP